MPHHNLSYFFFHSSFFKRNTRNCNKIITGFFFFFRSSLSCNWLSMMPGCMNLDHTVLTEMSQMPVCMYAKSLQSCLTLCDPMDPQSPLSKRFSRQEYWSGLLCPPPGDLPDPGIEPESLTTPALAGRPLQLVYLGSPK